MQQTPASKQRHLEGLGFGGYLEWGKDGGGETILIYPPPKGMQDGETAEGTVMG